jgi:hypothetical protein
MKSQCRIALCAIMGVLILGCCPTNLSLSSTFATGLFRGTTTNLSLSDRASDFHKTDQKEKAVTNHATGTFEVKMNPQTDEKVGDPTVGRMEFDKQFHGDLEAISKGQMLAVMSEVKGSGGYVALERVTGTLAGHSGTFALQHSGTMNRGAAQLSITVVPDSGTGQLVGLSGKMTINIVDGKHSFEFDYTLEQP